MKQDQRLDAVSSADVRPPESKARTGIRGLDEIMSGGLARDRLYLIAGEPGTGKTTLAMQFLLEGQSRGERGLYVTLSETAEELHASAASHGWELGDLEIFELATSEAASDRESYTLFHPSEVELSDTVGSILAAVERGRPSRVVFDSLSEMRLLARDALRFRRQILALKQYFVGRDCTVLLLDDRTAPDGDMQLHSLAHGVISLEHIAMEYGAERRRLQVKKMRGARFRGGYHDFRIRTGGIEVYPRILRNEPPVATAVELLTSGSAQLDALLGGGIMRGSSALITGPAGTGKSVLAAQYALQAVARGERVQFYLFDERTTTFVARADGLGLDHSAALADKRLVLRQVEPTEMSPGEFANEIVRVVEEEDVSLIVLDSINGFLQAMPAESLLGVQVHELLSYLANRGVTIVMTLVQHGIFGGRIEEAADLSYLADTVVLLRYFEYSGAVRRAISVVKRRSGLHEATIRECRVGEGGLRVGDPLVEFQGVLLGVPRYVGQGAPLMDDIRAADGMHQEL